MIVRKNYTMFKFVEMGRPSASNSQDVTDGKLKANLVWPNPAKPGACFQSFNTSLKALKAEKIKITSRQVWFSRPQKRRLGRDVYKIQYGDCNVNFAKTSWHFNRYVSRNVDIILLCLFLII